MLILNRALSNSLLLGLEGLGGPRLAGAAVAEPLVEPVLAVLPELVDVGHEAIAAPVGRPWDLAWMGGVELGEQALELLARLDRLALARH